MGWGTYSVVAEPLEAWEHLTANREGLPSASHEPLRRGPDPELLLARARRSRLPPVPKAPPLPPPWRERAWSLRAT